MGGWFHYGPRPPDDDPRWRRMSALEILAGLMVLSYAALVLADLLW